MTSKGQKSMHTLFDVNMSRTASYDVGPYRDYIECSWTSLWMTLRG